MKDITFLNAIHKVKYSILTPFKLAYKAENMRVKGSEKWLVSFHNGSDKWSLSLRNGVTKTYKFYLALWLAQLSPCLLLLFGRA